MSLAPVVNIRQTGQDATGTSFAWDPVQFADTYQVRVLKLDGTVLSTVNVTATSAKVTPPAGSYNLGVVPKANPTPATQLAFTVPPPGPSPPTGLAVVANSATRTTSSWNAVAGALHYDLFRDGVLAFTTTALTVADPTVSPSTTYQYQVRVTTAAGTSALSAAVPVTTPAQAAVPPTPTNFTATVGGTPTAPDVALGWTAGPNTVSIDVFRDGVLIASGVAP